MKPSRLQAGSPVIPGSGAFYVVRDADRLVRKRLLDGEFVHIAEPRQQGKTSLLLQLQAEFAGTDRCVLYLDLAPLPEKSRSRWYAALFDRLRRQWQDAFQLPLPYTPPAQPGAEDWNYFLNAAEDDLQRRRQLLIIAIDEVRVPHFVGGDALFIRIREHTAQVPRRISFLLAGVFAPNELIKDSNISPFNVGRRVRIDDFSAEEVARLMQSTGLPASTVRTLAPAVFRWTDGHPFLTQCVCDELPCKRRPAEAVADALAEVRRNQAGHFQHLGERIMAQRDLRAAAAQVLRDGPLPIGHLGTRIESELEILGLIKKKGRGWQMRNQLYIEAFQRELVPSPAPPHPVFPLRRARPPAGKHVFISYAREDQRALSLVTETLKAEWLQDGFIPWADTELRAGDEYRERLTEVLASSTAVILLLSRHFFVSDFIRKVELPLIVRHNRKGVPVFPLVVSVSPWDRDPWISKLQVHPRDGRTMEELRGPTRGKALQQFARELAACLAPAVRTRRS